MVHERSQHPRTRPRSSTCGADPLSWKPIAYEIRSEHSTPRTAEEPQSAESRDTRQQNRDHAVVRIDSTGWAYLPRDKASSHATPGTI